MSARSKKWLPGVMCEETNGKLSLFKSLEEAEKSGLDFTGEYREVEYYWPEGCTAPMIRDGDLLIAVTNLKTEPQS